LPCCQNTCSTSTFIGTIARQQRHYVRVLSGGAGVFALRSYARSRTAEQQAAARDFDDSGQEKQDPDRTQAGEEIDHWQQDEAQVPTFSVGLDSRVPRAQKGSYYDQEETR
jgi:hypothetical protein